jgi:DNA-binding transcriptional MocR family regulator
MVYEFCSTSKVTFPGSGIAAMACSEANVADALSRITWQTIGHDKINQMRHVQFFGNIDGMKAHMKKHAAVIRPKFEAFYEVFDRDLEDLQIAEWTKPKGGYFISFDTLPGCAKDVVAKCKKGGVMMTKAGATWPYGRDPFDTNIRIAPSYPPLEDLKTATGLFALCVKLSSAKKILDEKKEAAEAESSEK